MPRCECARPSCLLCRQFRVNPAVRRAWGGIAEEEIPVRVPPDARPALPAGTARPPIFVPLDPHPTSSRCLLTLSIGRAGREMEELSGPVLRRYAEKCGADYRVLRLETSAFPCGEKWRAKDVLPHYERVAWFDLDTLIDPDAPSIFDAVPAGRIGLFDEYELHRAMGDQLEWVWEEYRRHWASQGWPNDQVHLPRQVWNTGVYVLDREHAGFYDLPYHPFPDSWCAEQWAETAAVLRHGYPVFPLGPDWNHVWWQHRKDRHDMTAAMDRPIPGVRVYHWAGLGFIDSAERLRQMARMRAILYPDLSPVTAPEAKSRPVTVKQSANTFTPTPFPPLDFIPAKPLGVLMFATSPTSRQQADITAPLWSRLAAKWGAEFVLATEKTQPDTAPGSWEKMRTGQYLREFDRLMVVDADTVPHPDAPNPFRAVRRTDIGAVAGNGRKWYRVFYRHLKLICKTQGWELPGQFERFNSGVLVLSREHAGLYDVTGRSLPAGGEMAHTLEENVLNLNACRYRFSLKNLDWEWNASSFERALWGDALKHAGHTNRRVWVYHPGGYSHDARMKVLTDLRDRLYPGDEFAPLCQFVPLVAAAGKPCHGCKEAKPCRGCGDKRKRAVPSLQPI